MAAIPHATTRKNSGGGFLLGTVEDDPERPAYILTVHGQGYRFAG